MKNTFSSWRSRKEKRKIERRFGENEEKCKKSNKSNKKSAEVEKLFCRSLMLFSFIINPFIF